MFPAFGLSLAVLLLCQDDPVAHFGTTVVISNGLRGDLYFIPPNSRRLPNFKALSPQGTIYTSELNIPRQSFLTGFPGVTARFEWFALDYDGKFWIQDPGKYTFALFSDDGSKLYIDGHQVIDNDGIHEARAHGGMAKLKHGLHQIRVEYFQGPRTEVALILAVAAPGEREFRVFNTEDFLTLEEQTDLFKAQPDRKRPNRAPAERLVRPRAPFTK